MQDKSLRRLPQISGLLFEGQSYLVICGDKCQLSVEVGDEIELYDNENERTTMYHEKTNKLAESFSLNIRMTLLPLDRVDINPSNELARPWNLGRY
jgi:hypothetical protein